MRKIIFELVLLGIAIGLTVEVIKSAVPYLPLIWLAVLGHYTWEAMTTNHVLGLSNRFKVRWSGTRLMYSYGLVALLGAGLFVLYWWGLNSFFAPKIAAYEAERNEKQTAKKEEQPHDQPAQPPPNGQKDEPPKKKKT